MAVLYSKFYNFAMIEFVQRESKKKLSKEEMEMFMHSAKSSLERVTKDPCSWWALVGSRTVRRY